MQSDKYKYTQIPMKGTTFIIDMLQESVLRNVTLYGTDSFASGIPLFMLETDKPTFQAICVTKSTVLQFVSLSLATCRALGYDALQRYDTCSSVVLKKTFFYATIHSSYCIF
jgi:hypothetical protein